MISRSLNPLVFLDKKKSVLLLGPRGVGKTALVQEISRLLKQRPSARFVELDLLQGRDFSRYVGNPGLLSKELVELEAKHESIVVSIDEVQKIPALLDEVHHLIEKFQGKIIFLLSGSSARKLKRGGANLLASRAISCKLYPLSQLELDLSLPRALQFGTMPGVYLGDPELDIPTLETYVSTYLREEVQQESLVRRVDRFARFLEFAAQNNGQSINFTKLGKQIGILGKTVSDYYSILTDTLIVYEIPGWAESLRRQLLQAPKFYFFDCGVLNALNGYLRLELRAGGGYLFGNLFETLVVNQLISANSYLSTGLRFYYWRDKDGHEVDLVLARNSFEPVLAIEIKSQQSPNAADCPGFRRFREDYPKVPQICACMTPRSYSDQGVQFVPWKEALDLRKFV